MKKVLTVFLTIDVLLIGLLSGVIFVWKNHHNEPGLWEMVDGTSLYTYWCVALILFVVLLLVLLKNKVNSPKMRPAINCGIGLVAAWGLSVLIWSNYAWVLCNPVEELERVTVAYWDSESEDYKEIQITEHDKLEEIYAAFKNAKLKKVIRFSDADSEPDPLWSVTFQFEKETEWFDNTYYEEEYGVRKHITTGNEKGYVLLAGEAIYGIVEHYTIGSTQ